MARQDQAENFSFEKLNILIVDDQAFLRSLIKSLLKGFGSKNIFEARDGKNAIETIEKNPDLDVILCDIEMKPMNGLKLVRAIRAGLTEAAYDLPIIMLTVHSEKEMVQEALFLHVNGFLVKPVRPVVLCEKIEMVINNPLAIEQLILEEEEEETSSSTTTEEEIRARGWVLRKPGDVAKIKENLRKRMVTRTAGELTPGSTVAEDIRTPAGGIIVHRGVTLTSELIELIQRNRDISHLDVLE